MTTQQHPAQFDWATELLDAEGHVTLSAKEANEIGARLRSMGEKLKAYEDLDEAASDVQLLRMGYAAARLEIESLQARIKTMAEEHADELMLAHLDGRSQAAQQPAPSVAVHKACKPDMLVNGGALKLALNVLRRAGKHEVADELEATAQPTPTPQADSQPIQAAPAAVAGPHVTDAMALAFHSALSDGALGSDEVEEIKAGLRAALAAAFVQPAPPQEPSHTAVQLAELVLSDCGHSSNYTPLLDRVAARIDSHTERRLDELRRCLESKPAPQQEPIKKGGEA